LFVTLHNLSNFFAIILYLKRIVVIMSCDSVKCCF
jgi:hypothetical protein